MTESGIPLPPASFEFLVLSLKFQAESHLGLFHFGEEKDQPGPDLDAARHVIDLLAVLQDKTRNNLKMEEQRLLDNSLTELRFRYVQARDAAAAKKSEPAAAADTSEAESSKNE